MRYRDAAHVDVGSFYARRPGPGKVYRMLGHAAVVTALLVPARGDCLGVLLLGLIVVWLAAWYQVVGTLWRSTLVAACLIAALRLTALVCPAFAGVLS
jgi:hypothetical protein